MSDNALPYRLRYYGDPALEQPCAPILSAADIPDGLIRAMRHIMEAGRGVGLAAPQVGVPIALALIQVNGHLQVAINPVLEQKSTETKIEDEGCLSIPNFYTPKARHRTVRVRYQDEQMVEYSRLLVGFEARIAQHELAHLAGETIVTGAPRHVRRQAQRAVEKALSSIRSLSPTGTHP